jgi:uncharacterized membrane protein YraQ (UPF0718 family)
MTTWLPAFQIIFLSLFLQGIPFLLIGSFLGATISVFVPIRSLASRLPKSKISGILIGTFAGLLIPSCECIGVPLVRRLIRNGLPPATAIAYLLACPVLNPVCLASTWIAFQYDNPLMAILTRAGGAAFLAVSVALIFSRFPARAIFRAGIVANDKPNGEAGLWENPPAAWLANKTPRLASAISTGFSDFFGIAVYYLLGCLIAAGVQTALPPYAIPNTSPALLIPGFMGLSVITSLCSSADAFVAKSFAGYPLASLFAFMWLGAVLDLKLIFIYQSVFKRRTVLLLALLLAALVFALSLLAAYLPLERLFYGTTISG